MEVLVPHISCIVTENELSDELKAQYGEIFILTGSGIFKQMKLKGNRHIRFPVDSIPNYKSAMTAEYNFLPAGRIPYSMLEQLVEFFKAVMVTKKSDLEAMAHILYNPETGYRIGVPNQKISKASVTYDWEGYLGPTDFIVLDIHSHNTMGAFFSGTDNNDDRVSIGYSAVVGQLDKPVPAIVCRFNIRDLKRECKLEEIFEVPHKEVAINPEWLEKIQTGNSFPVGPFTGVTGGRYPGQNRNGNSHPAVKGRVVTTTPFPVQNGQTGKGKTIGSKGKYLETNNPSPQEKFPGFEKDEDMNFWLRRYHNGLSHESDAAGGATEEVSSTFNPKTGTIQRTEVETSGWNRMSEVKAVEGEKKGIGPARQKGKDSSPGEDDYFMAEHGEDIADAKASAEAWIDDLEGCDEALIMVLMYAYDKLSEAAQMKLMTEGL